VRVTVRAQFPLAVRVQAEPFDMVLVSNTHTVGARKK
jgi:hypothetical protein